jgi:hypothetical protein
VRHDLKLLPLTDVIQIIVGENGFQIMTILIDILSVCVGVLFLCVQDSPASVRRLLAIVCNDTAISEHGIDYRAVAVIPFSGFLERLERCLRLPGRHMADSQGHQGGVSSPA